MIGDYNSLSSRQSLRHLNLLDIGDPEDRVRVKEYFGETFSERWRKVGAVDVEAAGIAGQFAVEIAAPSKFFSDNYRVGLCWDDATAVEAGPWVVDDGQTLPPVVIARPKGRVLELWCTEDESVTLRTFSVAVANERAAVREQAKADEKSASELAADTAKTVGVVAALAAVAAIFVYFVVLK